LRPLSIQTNYARAEARALQKGEFSPGIMAEAAE
jgi:hypothetical protein